MKAIQLLALHQPLALVDVPDPVPQPGEMVVDVKAAGLNHRDVFVQQGLYPGIVLPVFPGSDGAGIVSAVGEGVDRSWLNCEVIINPALNWGANHAVNSPAFTILGMPTAGTFAEKIVISKANVYHKPSHLSFDEAAALPLAGLTAWRALMSRAALSQSNPERVLITGVGGGAALFALQFAVAAGADVWVTSGSDEKLAKARELGAKGGVNYKEADWHKTLLKLATNGDAAQSKAGYFDVIIDSAAGPDFAKLTQVAAPAGRIAFFGGTSGKITDVQPSVIFFKQLSIFGTTMGNDAEFADMLRFVEKHQLRPVIDSVRPLAEAQAAYDRLHAGQQLGKLVLSIA
ncbi:zinc-binding dehydrogenase [Fibrivirga algicola]|uniref:Zinc-binding dehydrogenase n=1 Tax=Fibrivirga algicola TaxID=2950420 RepID=A0ABX0QJC3_9BACT|nr:zinc-binding dehydrogenase [Fibrivirga algicola]NID10743.1 zinc-binding dehydrogenase [Fibrivirga algicola]